MNVCQASSASINVHEFPSTHTNLYITLYHSLSTSIHLIEPRSISISLYEPLSISNNRWPLLSTSIILHQPPSISISLYQPLSVSINLYRSLPIFVEFSESLSRLISITLDQCLSISIILCTSLPAFINVYQPLSISFNPYQSLLLFMNLYRPPNQYQSVLISMTLNPSLSIFSRPRAFLLPGCFLGSAAVGRRPLESADPSGVPACGRRKRDTSLASTALEGRTGACGQSPQSGKLLSRIRAPSLL